MPCSRNALQPPFIERGWLSLSIPTRAAPSPPLQDDYSATQRTIDTWAFFVTFRSRLYLLDKKWAYAGVVW